MKRIKKDLGKRDEMRAMRLLRGQLSNIDRIEVAMKGWGTDEEMLKEALRNLTATEFAQLTPELLVRQIQLDSLESAEEVLRDLENGGNFEVIAREKSKNQNRNQGGLMPWRKINNMPSVFA